MSCDYDSKDHTQPRTNVTQQNITEQLMTFRVSKCINCVLWRRSSSPLHAPCGWASSLLCSLLSEHCKAGSNYSIPAWLQDGAVQANLFGAWVLCLLQFHHLFLHSSFISQELNILGPKHISDVHYETSRQFWSAEGVSPPMVNLEVGVCSLEPASNPRVALKSWKERKKVNSSDADFNQFQSQDLHS